MNSPSEQNLAKSGKPNLLQLITGVVAFIVLVCALFFGYSAGMARAESTDTYNSVEKLYQALQYFNQDESQYPTQDQFQNQILIPTYVDKVIAPTDNSGVCKGQSQFNYSRPSAGTYQLQFCLSKGVKGLAKGDHLLTDQGLVE